MRIERIVDLSRPLDETTVVYPGDPAPRSTGLAAIERDGYALSELCLGSHSGTHVDAPAHVEPGAAAVDAVPLARFVGPGVLLDATGHAPGSPIGPEVLDPHLDALRQPGAIALVRTGWDVHYGTARYFEHPYLHTTLCERLIELGVRTVLIDALSIDRTQVCAQGQPGLPAHHVIARAGGVIGENLCDLARIDWPDPLVSVLPLPLPGGDGAPVRAVALQVACE